MPATHISWLVGATAARLTPDQKAGGSNPSRVKEFTFFFFLSFFLLFLLLSLFLLASRLPDSGPDLEGMEPILQIQT